MPQFPFLTLGSLSGQRQTPQEPYDPLREIDSIIGVDRRTVQPTTTALPHVSTPKKKTTTPAVETPKIATPTLIDPLAEIDRLLEESGPKPQTPTVITSPTKRADINLPVDDEPAFQSWYAKQATTHGLNPNPDAADQFYDYRGAFRAGAQPDQTGHWPSQFKKPGHPNEVVGGFNTRTGARVPGTKQASEPELVALGWAPEDAKRLSREHPSTSDIPSLLPGRMPKGQEAIPGFEHVGQTGDLAVGPQAVLDRWGYQPTPANPTPQPPPPRLGSAKTGGLATEPPMGQGILDTSLEGVKQFAGGVKDFVTAPTVPVTMVSPKTGQRYQTTIPKTEAGLAAASDMIEGAFKAGTPLLVPAMITNPLITTAVMAAGIGAQVGAEKGAAALGATPEEARFVGNLAAILAGGAAHKGIEFGGERVSAARTAAASDAEARAAAAQVLGVDPHADADTLKSAYRDLARANHPDLNPDADATTMADINLAYEWLTDHPTPNPKAPRAPKQSVADWAKSQVEWLKSKLQREPAASEPSTSGRELPGAIAQEAQEPASVQGPAATTAGPASPPVPPPVDQAQAPAPHPVLDSIDQTLGLTQTPEFGPDAYAGPDRRAAERVSTPEQDEKYQRMREKIAAGEPTGTEESRQDFAERQRVEETRRQGAVDEVTAMEPERPAPVQTKPVEEMTSEEFAQSILAELEKEQGLAAAAPDVTTQKDQSGEPRLTSGTPAVSQPAASRPAKAERPAYEPEPMSKAEDDRWSALIKKEKKGKLSPTERKDLAALTTRGSENAYLAYLAAMDDDQLRRASAGNQSPDNRSRQSGVPVVARNEQQIRYVMAQRGLKPTPEFGEVKADQLTAQQKEVIDGWKAEAKQHGVAVLREYLDNYEEQQESEDGLPSHLAEILPALQRMVVEAEGQQDLFKEKKEKDHAVQKQGADEGRVQRRAGPTDEGESQGVGERNTQSEEAAGSRQAKEEVAQKEPSAEQKNSSGATVTHNAERGSIEIRFTAKPSVEIRAKLKSAHFKWAKTNKLWYRQLPFGQATIRSKIDTDLAAAREMVGREPPAPAPKSRPAISQPTKKPATTQVPNEPGTKYVLPSFATAGAEKAPAQIDAAEASRLRKRLTSLATSLKQKLTANQAKGVRDDIREIEAQLMAVDGLPDGYVLLDAGQKNLPSPDAAAVTGKSRRTVSQPVRSAVEENIEGFHPGDRVVLTSGGVGTLEARSGDGVRVLFNDGTNRVVPISDIQGILAKQSAEQREDTLASTRAKQAIGADEARKQQLRDENKKLIAELKSNLKNRANMGGVDPDNVRILAKMTKNYVGIGVVNFRQAVFRFQQEFGEGSRSLDRAFEIAWRMLRGEDGKVADALAIKVTPHKLSGDSADVQVRAIAALSKDPDKYREDYLKRFGRVLNADNASELFEDYARSEEARAKLGVAVRAPAGALVDSLFEYLLAADPTTAEPVVVFTAGGNASGKSSGVADEKDADIIFDSTFSNLPQSQANVEKALDAGRDVRVRYVWRDPVRAMVDGALPRAMGEANGRTVTARGLAATHIGSRETVLALAKAYAGDPRVTFAVRKNIEDDLVKRDVKWLEQQAYNERSELETRLFDALETEHDAGRISDAVYEGTRGIGRRLEEDRRPDGRGLQEERGEESPASGREAAGTPEDVGAPTSDRPSAILYDFFNKRSELPKNNVEMKALIAKALPDADPNDNATLNAATDAIEAVLASRLHGPDMAAAHALETQLTRAYRTPEKMRLQQFSTPLPIAVAAVEAAQVTAADHVLEPTAGTGNLIAPLRGSGATVTAIELDPSRVALLNAQGWTDARIGNYLTRPIDKDAYTVIVANPPWGKYTTGKYGRPIAGDFTPGDVAERFVAKMIRELKPGGRLVAVMPTTMIGPKGVAFRVFLDKHGSIRAVIKSPPGAYDTRGTSVESLLLVWDKGERNVDVGQYVSSLDTADWEAYTEAVGRIGDRARLTERPGDTAVQGQQRSAGSRAGSVGQRPIGGVSGPAGDALRPQSGRAPDVVAGVQPGHVGAVGDAEGETERPTRAAGEDATRGLSEAALDAFRAAERSERFSPYRLRTTLNGVRHPRVMVEARGLAGVEYPPLTYHPSARFERIIASGRASIEQAEQALAAVQANIEGHHGYLAADNVGVGKAREAWLSVIELMTRAKAENRPLRLMVTTKNADNIASLIEGELPALVGQDPGFEIVRVADYKDSRQKPGKTDPIEPLPQAEHGVYVVDSYNLAPYREALLDVGLHGIVGDEAHRFKNADASVGAAWQQIHARIFQTAKREEQAFVYFTATPAQAVEDYAYLYGLRMWPIDGFQDWVDMVTGQATEDQAKQIRDAAEAGGYDIETVSENAGDTVVGGDSEDTARGERTAQMGGGDVFSSRLTPAEGEQITREWKRMGRFSSRDLWREGTEFVVQTEHADDTSVQRYDDFTKLSRDIISAAEKFGKLNKAVRSGIGGVKSQLQFAAKRVQMQPSLEAAVRIAQDHIDRGYQVVLSMINVSEFDAEQGNIAAAINQINIHDIDVTNGEVIDNGEIPEAMQARAELMEQSAELGKLPSPITYIEEAFGPENVAFVIGQSKGREKHVAEFQNGERAVAVISAAGSTGISLDHRVKTKGGVQGRRVFIDVQFDWSATEAIQRYGRVDRASQITAPKIIALNFGTAAEKKFLSTIANRLASLGALSKGGSETTGTDLEEFEIDGNEATAAARNAWNALPDTTKDYFTGRLFRDPKYPAKPAKNTSARIKDIMLSLLFVPTGEANAFWRDFIVERDRLRAMQTAGVERRTNAAKGEVLRTLNLTPELTLYQVKNANNERMGILTGVVMPEMPRIRDFLRDSDGNISRRYTAFTAGDQVVAGLIIPWGRTPGLASFYGRALKAEKLDTPEKVTEALRAGDVLELQQKDASGRPWRLRQRQDKRIAIDGVKMSDLKLVRKHGVQYHAAGNWWEAQELPQFLERFPVALPKVEPNAADLEDGDESAATKSEGESMAAGGSSGLFGGGQTPPPPRRPSSAASAPPPTGPLPDAAGLTQERTTNIRGIVPAIRALIDPEGLGPDAKGAAGTIRHEGALSFHALVVAHEQLKDFSRRVEKLSREDAVKYWDAAEHGRPTGDAEMDAGNALLHQITDTFTQQLVALDRLKAESTIENYVGRFWSVKPDYVPDFVRRALGRRPLEGPKSFLKQRTWESFAEGIRAIKGAQARIANGSPRDGDERLANIRPATYNWVESQLAKIAEMQRVIAAERMLRQEHAAGRATKVMDSMGKKPPKDADGEDWVRLGPDGDPAFTIFGPKTVTIDEAYDAKLMEGLHNFARSLGVQHVRKIAVGGNRWGYAVGASHITTKVGGPEGVLMHEIGHILDERYGLRSKWVTDPTMKKELRALADMREEGSPSVAKSRQRYLRKGSEKIANAINAFLYMPERMKKIAPNVYWAIHNLAKDNPELRPLLDLQKHGRSLKLDVNTTEQEIPGFPVVGHWYAPKAAAAVWSNHLSKGMRGNPLYDAYSTVANGSAQILLGFSGFHFTTIAREGLNSRLAQSVDALANRGRHVAIGEAVRLALSAPSAIAVDAAFGRRIMQEYRAPGTHPELARVLDAMMAGGYRGTAESEFWTGQRVEALKTAFKKAVEGAVEGDTGKLLLNGVKVPLDAVWAGIELTMKPLMGKYVPWMKTGATYRAVAQALAKLPKNAPLDQVHEAMWNIVKEMDFRYGQVVYDNHFVNRMVKDLAHAMFLAPGWTFGTIGLATRGLKQTAALPVRGYQIASGKQTGPIPDELVGSSAAYWIGGVLAFMFINGVLTFLHTGDAPTNAKDYFAYRDGTVDDDGNANRHVLPGYEMRDIYGWSHHPVDTLGNKLKPAIAFLYRLARNRTYFGDLIYNPEADTWTKALQLGRAAVEELGTPLSVQNYQESRHRGGAGAAEVTRNVLGITPAKREFERTKAQNLLAEYIAREGHTARTPEEVENADQRRAYREALRKGDRVAAVTIARTEGLSKRQITTAKEAVNENYLQRGFKGLTIDHALSVYEAATPQERAQIELALRHKWHLVVEAPPDERDAIRRRFAAVSRLPVQRGRPAVAH